MFRTSIPQRWAWRFILGVGCFMGVAGTVSAQGAPTGGRLAARVDRAERFRSTQLPARIASGERAFAVHGPAPGAVEAINGDLNVRLASGDAGDVFSGALASLSRSRLGRFKTTDLGGDLLGGIETRIGRIRPLLQGRLRFRDGAVQLGGGVHITLGRRR